MKRLIMLMALLLLSAGASANIKISGYSGVATSGEVCPIGAVLSHPDEAEMCIAGWTYDPYPTDNCPADQYDVGDVLDVSDTSVTRQIDITKISDSNCDTVNWQTTAGVYFSTTSDPVTMCPDNSAPVNGTCPSSYKFISKATQDASHCPPCKGDPVDVATGEELLTEQDIAPSPNGALAFIRYYSSQIHVGDYSALGHGWRSNYSRAMDVNNETTTLPSSTIYSTPSDACISGWSEVAASSFRGLASGATASYSNGTCQLTLSGAVVGKLVMQNFTSGPSTSGVIHTITRPNGRAYVFEQNGTAWQERYGASVTLIQVTDGWLFTDTDGTQEHYDSNGHLTTITDRAGHIQTLSYDSNGRLSSVSDDYNRHLTFAYDSYGRIVTVTDPNGGLYRYTYNGSQLYAVSYPDNTPTVTSDNPTRHYIYGDSAHPYALTGITDENGKRFATLTYDAQQRVLSSEHAGGEGHINFTYNSDGSTTLTYANGRVETYHFSVINGSLKVTNVTHQ